MEIGDEGKLVEKGAFRVDRVRALEKLSRFQLGDARFGLLFWVRFAVANGATRFELDPKMTSFKLRFDGAALTKELLDDPYGPLFAEDAPRRNKNFAYALLWTRRLGGGLARLRLTSGPIGCRWGLTASGGGPESVAASKNDGRGTELSVSGLWAGVLQRPWSPRPGFLEGMLWTEALPVVVAGTRVPVPFLGDAVRSVELSGGARALMRPAFGVRRSSAAVYVEGVSAGRFEFPSRAMPSESIVQFPEAKLDASQAQAVRDGALDALLQELASHELALLAPALDSAPQPESELAGAVRAACRLMLTNPESDSKDPLLARLWDALLYRYSWGGQHSLREVVFRVGLEKDLVGLKVDEQTRLAAFLARVRRVP